MRTNMKYNNITIDIKDNENGYEYSDISNLSSEESDQYSFSSNDEQSSLPPPYKNLTNTTTTTTTTNNNNNSKSFNYSRNMDIREHINGSFNNKNYINSNSNLNNSYFDKNNYFSKNNNDNTSDTRSSKGINEYWTAFTKTLTCCICSVCLKKCGMTSEPVQMAWREKITMVIIYLVMMALTGYFTFGLQKTICHTEVNGFNPWRTINNDIYTINKLKGPIIRGYTYNYQELEKLGLDIPEEYNNTNLNSVYLYNKSGEFKSSCKNFVSDNNCHIMEQNDFNIPCQNIKILNRATSIGKQLYTWEDIEDSRKPNTKIKPKTPEDYEIFKNSKLLVFNGAVVNVTNLINDSNYSNLITAKMKKSLKSLIGLDASLYINRMYKYKSNYDMSCILEQFIVGYVDKKSTGCFISQVFIYTTLILILGVVLARFFMAIIFRYFMAPRLFKKRNYDKNTINGPRTKMNTIRAITYHSKDMVMNNSSSDTLTYLNKYMNSSDNISSNNDHINSINNISHDEDSANDDDVNKELYTICLVTCYSEGEQGIHSTIDSLASTIYNDSKKLLFIIADGLIKGEGNNQLTSDIILSLMTENYSQYKNPRSKMPEPKGYVSLGLRNKQNNMARVHAGIYTSLDRKHQVPIIVVVKCGTPEEANDAKPGNRGKRDSQVILMNFLNRVLFNDRMTPLDYELTYQIQRTTGVFPDAYEIVLMVDADTIVKPKSLHYMVKAMVCDEKIMGLCGETRILNKTESFITGIQVFEYYISHHLGKAFESVFGGVTCLPGCFCMYRIKSPKNHSNYVVPILVNPDIISEYSQTVVDSLHQKNLLLLGEDRFLSTLMLKTFPKRKMMFLPQARCKTIVPDTFKVLLSQRRRWINSTIHNLVKLVFVNDLCGIFCFSMQFVVFFELCGTVVLPAALSFTIYITLSFIFTHSVEILPVIMLFAILGLPGVLIFLTSNKWNYILWMIVYLIALPIWNFILPLYAVWHMDDFSWGETRKITTASGKHESSEMDITNVDLNNQKIVPMKQWADYEYERIMENRNKYSFQDQGSNYLVLGKILILKELKILLVN
ncbi:hypothetical protein BCR32DRAFT_263190 [Anaeromyces robustus]|uniref:chitin synthase n=1 Tax=Anaeromyces robustus TaxID=1754192 RepID=A0A1Y1WWQ6_9FUNG|nr:hypothetical protein BCR32DRAFT_263190 [Anaeromyces robustus]|eukprot:ORX77892.1 hypothetical protein BCR32DRAFT_263190 [Anaeromyces robustus]